MSRIRDLAKQICTLHGRVNELMIEIVREALAETGSFEEAKNLIKPFLLKGLTESSFNLYFRRARLAVEYNIAWDYTDPSRFTIREIKEAFKKNPNKVMEELDNYEDKRAARLQSALNKSRKIAKKHGKQVILVPLLGQIGTSKQWIEAVTEAYQGVNLPRPEKDDIEYRLCYDFINKCRVLAEKHILKTKGA